MKCRTVCLILISFGLALTLGACGEEQKSHSASAKPKTKPKSFPPRNLVKETSMEPEIEEKLNRFVRTEIGVKAKRIPQEHRNVIRELVAASRIIDRLFLVQVAGDNPKTRHGIYLDPKRKVTLELFDVMYGPWDRLDENKPFYGKKTKPKGAGYYPDDLTVEEFENWIKKHPRDKEAFKSYFTVIKRDKEKLVAVPYSTAYEEYLEPAGMKLKKAAEVAEDERLANYLNARAKAFESNEYRESDMAWMDLGDGDLEVVIGPYEVYEDDLLGLKAAFETYIALRNAKDSNSLNRIKSYIPDMEAYLPIPDEYKNPNRGAESPISVVDLLYSAGDARAGVQTMAFNLPNDEVVREKKGSKKVLFKNVARAKFERILMPIAEQLLTGKQLPKVTFAAFFNHTLLHEIAHALGPGKITVEGKNKKNVSTTVNDELKDLYSVIEEAKADVLGMYLNFMLIEKGVLNPLFEEQTYASFLAGFFRSVRFGADEAHGQANVIQFNYLSEQGAVEETSAGQYRYVPKKMKTAIRALAHDLLMIEAKGDYDGAKAFIEKYGTLSPRLKTALKTLSHLPTDIRPIYTVEKFIGV